MRITPSFQRLSLASHVRACASDGNVVLLDLRKSRYIGIGVAQSRALEEHIDGWPQIPGNTSISATGDSLEQLIAELLSRKLLTTQPCDSSPDPAVAVPTDSVELCQLGDQTHMSPLRLSRMAWFAVQASLRIRCCSLQSIAAFIAVQRKRNCPSTTTKDSLAKARLVASTFENMRPFFATAHENCLRDSLTLLTFLASEKVFPSWVIGVKTRPFAAHAWVQMGTTVLSDQHETVRQFRPILVV